MRCCREMSVKGKHLTLWHIINRNHCKAERTALAPGKQRPHLRDSLFQVMFMLVIAPGHSLPCFVEGPVLAGVQAELQSSNAVLVQQICQGCG